MNTISFNTINEKIEHSNDKNERYEHLDDNEEDILVEERSNEDQAMHTRYVV